ncbi:MAG TPA: hypothetical protein VFW03_04750 [Gemmatimonadaceae bacterium]|nr:hypothetical protein [Gemmatimonadaceae bacterium]
MNRFLYFAAFTYIALCGAIVARKLVTGGGPRIRTVDRVVAGTPLPPDRATTSGAQWFAAMKPYCNQVEVDVRERYSPPPGTSEGAGYAAACFALAGKIDRARQIIEGIAPSDRASAANVLFAVAHPVADAGDDRASGPMMELVLEYWPNNYMALYHAGMSEYSLGQRMLAEKHLQAFLQMYTVADYFHENAEKALRALDDPRSRAPGAPPRQVERVEPPRP